MRARRRLVLRKETLGELRPDELTRVAGAAATTPVAGCLEDVFSRVVRCDVTDSILRPCITYTCTR
jgi:hypothetical protein